MPGAILQRPRAQVRDFAALRHEHQARLIDLRPARHVATGAQYLYAGQVGRGETVAGREPLDQGNQRGIGVEMAGQQHGKKLREKEMRASSQV